jgi:hypothetical protein
VGLVAPGLGDAAEPPWGLPPHGLNKRPSAFDEHQGKHLGEAFRPAAGRAATPSPVEQALPESQRSIANWKFNAADLRAIKIGAAQVGATLKKRVRRAHISTHNLDKVTQISGLYFHANPEEERNFFAGGSHEFLSWT